MLINTSADTYQLASLIRGFNHALQNGFMQFDGYESANSKEVRMDCWFLAAHLFHRSGHQIAINKWR
jgi:hypothetical protein